MISRITSIHIGQNVIIAQNKCPFIARSLTATSEAPKCAGSDTEMAARDPTRCGRHLHSVCQCVNGARMHNLERHFPFAESFDANGSSNEFGSVRRRQIIVCIQAQEWFARNPRELFSIGPSADRYADDHISFGKGTPRL